MVCYKPLNGWYSSQRTITGKRSIVFDLKKGLSDRPITIPCGQCIGCRLERSRQWAVRCVHEASLYKNNSFITLTFNDESLYTDRNDRGFDFVPSSLDVADFQKFMKRLRKSYTGVEPVTDIDTGVVSYPIRFFHCGEYGGRSHRPHHHACLFNFQFDDLVLWQVKNGVKLYRSAKLEKLWPYGFCTVGQVTFDSSAYVARYIMKKITGEKAESFYGSRIPEYTTMSRRPGIARRWIEKYITDVYPNDFVVVKDGVKCKPPKYYDGVYELTDYKNYCIVKSKRKLRVIDDSVLRERSSSRLNTKMTCKAIQIKTLLRSYEQLC